MDEWTGVVDDEESNIFALGSYLEAREMEVVVAKNGDDMMFLLNKGVRPDIILLDIMMPVMDGLEATRRIRMSATLAKLPIIMLTAKAMPDDQARCLDAGANDYMAKPIDVDKLLSLVRVWMPR